MEIGAILTGCGLFILATTYVARPLFQDSKREKEIEAAVLALRQTSQAAQNSPRQRSPHA